MIVHCEQCGLDLPVIACGRGESATEADRRVVTGVVMKAHQPTCLGSGELTSIEFAHAARMLSGLVRGEGMEVPGFRSPPRDRDLTRSIRRERDGSPTVSVAIRGRSAVSVLGDMIDGCLTANHSRGSTQASRLRSSWTQELIEAVRSSRDADAR